MLKKFFGGFTTRSMINAAGSEALDALKERYRSASRLTPDVDKTFSDLKKAIERWD